MKEHPITYEHIGILICWLIAIFVVLSAGEYWLHVKTPGVKDSNIVKSIVCYNSNGEGPVENCPAKIECHNKENTNTNNSLIPCPFWPKR